tara:strand:+ start:725 stop:1372 length:648 start_codon:yes stop_codon:yes gene_type:complete
MGDPKKFRKKYDTPMHPWNKTRIDAERELKFEYGLPNKKEQWKMSSVLKRYKTLAKRLIADTTKQGEIEKAQMMEKLQKFGLLQAGAHLDDILSLEVKDIMERRLQTIVYKKGLARSVKQARQFIVHRHISVGEREVTFPSYLVSLEEEPLVGFRSISALKNEDHPERPTTEAEQIKEEVAAVKEVVPEEAEGSETSAAPKTEESLSETPMEAVE